jgi:predicted PurR-regulated permease PerM
MIPKELRIVAATVLGLLLAFLSYKVLKTFILGMAWALVLAVVLAPLRRQLARRVRSPFAASLLTTLAAFLLVFIPLSVLLWQLGQEMVTAYPAMMEQAKAIRDGQLQAGSDLQRWVQKGEALMQRVGLEPAGVVSFFADKFSKLLGNLFQNSFRFVFHLLFTLVFLFTFLRYGSNILGALRPVLPFDAVQQRYLQDKMGGFISSLFMGVFLTALVQGLVGAVGYAMFGLPSVIFLGALTFVFALIPMGGATLVWGPLALLLIAGGRTTAGILLLLYGGVLISGLDNILRPLLVAGKGKVNPVFVLVGVLGGVAGLGMIGLLYGPIILYLGLCVLQLMREGPAPGAA